MTYLTSSFPTPAVSSNFLTEVHLADAPAISRRFANLIGKDYWERRIAQMNAAISMLLKCKFALASVVSTVN